MDFLPHAAGPSAASGTPEDHRTIGVSHNEDSPNVHDRTGVWSLKAEEFSTFSPDSSRFLSGPGVIPGQGVVSLSPVPTHSRDKLGSPDNEASSFDDQRSAIRDQSSPREQGESGTLHEQLKGLNSYSDRRPKPQIRGSHM
jgi:hypothetical protein